MPCDALLTAQIPEDFMRIKKITILLSLITLLLTGCSPTSGDPLTRTCTLFDTVITIHIYDKDSDEVLDTCIEKCEDYEKKFSRTLEGSEIYLSLIHI